MQNLGIQAYEELALRNMRSSRAELYKVDNTETSYQILQENRYEGLKQGSSIVLNNESLLPSSIKTLSPRQALGQSLLQ